MLRKMIVLGILFVLATVACSAISEGQMENAEEQMNESAYRQVSDTILIEFNEDLNYSSIVLDGFVKGEITREQALSSTASVIMLTINTINTANRVNPPDKFADYHNYIILMLTDLQQYAWNLAKFYETEKSNYAIQARSHYNNSIENYDKVLKERAFMID
jgi:hypothetical protein